MLDPAPFFSDLNGWPEGGSAYWLRTQDGVRIRAAINRPEGATRGTILMCPGRTEYIEKYGGFAEAMGARGFTCLCVDWRGQGIADRLIGNVALGHVDVYTDYQRDMAALVDFATARGLPKPWHIVAHSMSGAIGLRAIIDGLPVSSCCFTGPMWGIAMSPLLRPLGALVMALGPALGCADKLLPTTSAQSYVLANPFEDNTLTTDADMFQLMRQQLIDHPEMALGGPTVGWFTSAIAECRSLASMASPDVPCLTIQGENERIVDTDAIGERMSRWPNGRLEVIAGAEHEVVMESPILRGQTLDMMEQHFSDNSAT